MEYIYIGKIVNTHALKGEVRIISNFEYKDRVFKKGNILYLGEDKSSENILTYRKHKMYDMVSFEGIDNINDVLKYKGSKVYIDSSILNLSDDELLEDEILELNVYLDNKNIGKITEYRNDNGNKMIRVNNKFIPFNKKFISKIEKHDKIIVMKDIEVFL